MKLLTATTLALSLCVGTVLPVAAENIVGTVKAWQYMQADGWKSADGLDNHTLSNALYGARVIDNWQDSLRETPGDRTRPALIRRLTRKRFAHRPRWRGEAYSQACWFSF